ncbi:MAG TPA: hypothetical protein PLJ60_02140 [Chryseolinea sp.]|nr:hypothetical protein [Chryseolinea sp.]
MKTTILMIAICLLAMGASAQSIIGKWQLVKQSNCVEDKLGEDDADTQDLVDDMKGMSGATPQVLTLKDKNAGEENTKIITKKKDYNSKSFLYKYDGEFLYFLDKKSRTIIEGFTVEKLSADSLIISNTSRACETRIFVRIN